MDNEGIIRRSHSDGLALIACEIGGADIRGPVRYPGKLGDIEVGGVDIVSISMS